LCVRSLEHTHSTWFGDKDVDLYFLLANVDCLILSVANFKFT